MVGLVVRPSIPLRVWCISPILFEVGIPNLVCGCFLTSGYQHMDICLIDIFPQGHNAGTPVRLRPLGLESSTLPLSHWAPIWENLITKILFLYPGYKVYKGYIGFAVSVIMFVCLSVCNLFFSVKGFFEIGIRPGMVECHVPFTSHCNLDL